MTKEQKQLKAKSCPTTLPRWWAPHQEDTKTTVNSDKQQFPYRTGSYKACHQGHHSGIGAEGRPWHNYKDFSN